MTNKEKLVEAYTEGLGIKPDQVVDTLEYQSIPQWDSISHMVLVSEIEDIFDVELDTDDVIDMSSVKIAKEILGKYDITFK